jgi:hypothetical protein
MTPEVITCGDLARLGGPWDALWQHDPRAMVPDDDVLCHCWHGAGPEDVDDPLECGYAFVVPIAEDRTVHLCCLCSSYFADVLRAQNAEGLWAWLQGQADEASAYRDQRRLDPSPVPCDMDVETAAVLDYLEGEDDDAR